MTTAVMSLRLEPCTLRRLRGASFAGFGLHVTLIYFDPRTIAAHFLCRDFSESESNVIGSVDYFRLIFSYTEPMFQGPPNQASFVIRCKGCGENVPAPVETLPASWIAAKCPLCGEHRRYLPTEIFRGRLSYALLRKPVRSAQGGAR